MDIHKPKPWHNWREFLKELGTIALGVCIALAAEQGVEWLHWQAQVKVARQALLAEIADNNARFFARRVAVHACMDRQINEADAILTALEEKRPPGKFTNFRAGAGGQLVDSEWQSQRASQVLTHFPHGEVAVMSFYYAQIPDFVGWNTEEFAAWSDLSVLQKPMAGMTVSDLLRLRSSLALVRIVEGRIVFNAQRQLARARQIGVPDIRNDPALVKEFCTTSLEESLRRNIANGSR
ncbi:MAG: hypothetical protein JO256_05225 [Alphaproteobacteria bacterium]|nr:hypothetical protein [Alphaproteobacteria bacterium]